MSNIIRGTTPTIKYMFRTVSVSDITVAYLTIRMDGELVIQKDLADATIGDGFLAWTLTQEETLALLKQNTSVMLNWKTAAGLRGASKRTQIIIERNDIEEVI